MSSAQSKPPAGSEQTDPAANSTEAKKPMTGAEVLQELRRAQIRAYTRSDEPSKIAADRAAREAKEKADEEARLKKLEEQQKKSDEEARAARVVEAHQSHPDIQMSFPPPTARVTLPLRLKEQRSPKVGPANGGIEAELNSIVEAAADIFGVALEVLLDAQHVQHVVRRRHVIAYFMLHYTQCTLEQAAKPLRLSNASDAFYARNIVWKILTRGPRTDVDKAALAALSKLYKRFNKEPPPSLYWPAD